MHFHVQQTQCKKLKRIFMYAIYSKDKAMQWHCEPRWGAHRAVLAFDNLDVIDTPLLIDFLNSVDIQSSGGTRQQICL